ncbi:hypothetical protein FD06_GL000657 [Apilactobacillus ozensis DSM 23829 = JCM 17196]|uniref:CAAX prenyl protease 2/Lysostaphin resistance protein A-like domain-containing protein n=1 Tax=Apilactobacillus ozensis DSM 23829 = JCM 17196 TaxID=1423781 RepID=A0A0R2AM16_9LACO|nr:type II CAAX endopeptidase family protein [Apilactobacillus ozensis]KRM67506.1 hypothetical protein FD06_GL000657 [Apilactobacillus ozensis DSM 23829 = JCM 17196]
MFSQKYDLRFLKAIFIYFIMSLVILTIDIKIAGSNSYVYIAILSVWFLGVLIYELKHIKSYLSEQWQAFKQNKLKYIIAIALFYIILQIAVMIAGKIFNGFAPAHNPYPSYGFPVETWIGLIMSIYVGVVNLGVAFVEELAFRHEMMYRFGSNKSLMILSVVISSLLFGFSHYYNFSGSLIASLSYAVAGVVLSIAYIVSKNIWVPIITHMLFNGIAVVSTVILIVFKIIGTI